MGGPAYPGPVHPNNSAFRHYINRLHFLHMLTDQECRNLFKCSHQELYKFRTDYVEPWWQQAGPNGGALKQQILTPDGMTAAFHLKMVKNPDYRYLASQFGCSPTALNIKINSLRDYIYQNDPWLSRNRNLANPRYYVSTVHRLWNRCR